MQSIFSVPVICIDRRLYYWFSFHFIIIFVHTVVINIDSCFTRSLCNRIVFNILWVNIFIKAKCNSLLLVEINYHLVNYIFLCPLVHFYIFQNVLFCELLLRCTLYYLLFSQGTLVSSIINTYRHKIAEILLKVALYTITITSYSNVLF